MTATNDPPNLPEYAHNFEALVASDARTHDLDEDCWCEPAVDARQRTITHRADTTIVTFDPENSSFTISGREVDD